MAGSVPLTHAEQRERSEERAQLFTVFGNQHGKHAMNRVVRLSEPPRLRSVASSHPPLERSHRHAHVLRDHPGQGTSRSREPTTADMFLTLAPSL